MRVVAGRALLTRKVKVRYKTRDGWHVFFSDEMPGLYVASGDLTTAAGAIIPAIKKLVELDEGIKVLVELC